MDGRVSERAPAMLVCDIDDTLTGDRKGLGALREWLREHPHTLFAVATGRHLEEALRILAAWQAPPPSLFITAVGSEIHHRRGGELVADRAWQEAIQEGWDAAAIDRLLEGMPGLAPQGPECQSAVKRSYFATSGAVAAEVRETLRRRGLGATVIWSHGQLLDVLPERASKGQALRFLLGGLAIAEEDVFAAGDSGNDEDLLTAAGGAVVVHSERRELEPLRKHTSIHFSDRPGAAGIMDGLERWCTGR
jgi:sucrose-phosphate synthase